MLFQLYFLKWLGEFADAHQRKPLAEALRLCPTSTRDGFWPKSDLNR